MRNPLPVLALAGALGLPTGAAATHYVIDPAQSVIRFTVPYTLMVLGQVQGQFGRYFGEAEYDPDALGDSWIRVVMETDSIATGLPTRDDHLKSVAFFATERHPLAAFRSSRFERTSEGLRLVGVLDLRGVRHEVAIPFSLASVDGSLVAWGMTEVSREDFGIQLADAVVSDSFVVGSRVTIQMNLLLRSAPPLATVAPQAPPPPYAGRYRSTDGTHEVRIEVLAGNLVVRSPDQPLAPLAEDGSHRFGIVGSSPAARLRFETEGGAVRALLIERDGQPPRRLLRDP